MSLGQRIEERRKAIGLSQAELARRVGVKQSTMHSLIKGDSRSSRSIVDLARELGTSPAFLLGHVDDPDIGAPIPAPQPRLQLVTMPVAIPTEDALADGFEAVLSVSTEMNRAELARELARSLPALLRLAASAFAVQPSAARPAADEAPPARPPADRARRRA